MIRLSRGGPIGDVTDQPACRCADGACPDAGWCRVATAACRGADGKLASYVGPNATETENTDVEWWAYC